MDAMPAKAKRVQRKKATREVVDDFEARVARHREEWRAIQAQPGPDWEGLHASVERLKDLTRRLERKYGRARV